MPQGLREGERGVSDDEGTVSMETNKPLKGVIITRALETSLCRPEEWQHPWQTQKESHGTTIGPPLEPIKVVENF